MGTFNSKETRRISFNNTFALTNALAVQKSIEDEHDVLDLERLAPVPDKSNELLFTTSNKSLDLENEDGENNYWANRIDLLKKEHREINKIIETEYEKALENTTKLLETEDYSQEQIGKLEPCYDFRNKIMRCYEENQHQPLVCSPLVEAFSRCVSSCTIER